MSLTYISPRLSVRPQIAPKELGALATVGFRGVINARPDGEEPGQPTSAELAAAAEQHGLAYAHIPVVPGAASEAQARAFAEAMEAADGPVVAFCRTGKRASLLFDMAQKLGSRPA